jgi:hypothetical protein
VKGTAAAAGKEGGREGWVGQGSSVEYARYPIIVGNEGGWVREALN